MATINITPEQLEKILDQHVEKMIASGILQKKGRGPSKKSASVAPSSSSDAASEAGSARSVGEGTRAWNDLTKIVSALVKEALAGQKGGAGFHLKVLSYLKNQKGLKSGETPSLDAVKDAVSFLKSNPEFKTPNQMTKEEKSESSGAGGGNAPAASVEKKKPGRPKKSEEDKEAEKEAKKATKEAEKEAKKAAKEAEKESKKSEKKEAKKAPAKAPEPEEEEEDEEEQEMAFITFDGQDLFWNEATGEAFEAIDGALGDLVGTFDGITLTPA